MIRFVNASNHSANSAKHVRNIGVHGNRMIREE